MGSTGRSVLKEGGSEIRVLFSQFPLCDCIPFLKVTAPFNNFHMAFSVRVQKMLPSLTHTSLALTSLFLQPLMLLYTLPTPW